MAAVPAKRWLPTWEWGGGNVPIVLEVLMEDDESVVSEDNGLPVCEQPPWELHGTGCLQRYAGCNWDGTQTIGTLTARNAGGGQRMPDKDNFQAVIQKTHRKYVVRRLTPLECCRLQGFPDWWEEGVQGSDSARYKMWGNGMALPNMLHVMRGIKRLTEEET